VARIKELEHEVIALKDVVREKEGINNLVKEEMVAQKRNAKLCAEQLAKVQAPLIFAQDSANKFFMKSELQRRDLEVAKLKADNFEVQLPPLLS